MTKEQIKTGIRESEEEIRKLRRDKKGNWKQFVKYYEGYIHGLKASQPKQDNKSQLKPQRELLIAFFMHFRNNGEQKIGMTIEEFVDDFLAIKCG